MRTLFSRTHATIYPNKGVFLAGPTPPDGAMLNGWRRVVVSKLLGMVSDNDCIVVSPEPESGVWESIVSKSSAPNESAENDQIAWELQYLKLCDIAAFWMPVYWSEASSENFPPNIGPTTRWEYGMILERFISSTNRKLIVGAPEDAQSIGWVKHTIKHFNLKMHWLPASQKHKLVCDSFIQEIADTLNLNCDC